MDIIKSITAAVIVSLTSSPVMAGWNKESFTVQGERQVKLICGIEVKKDTFAIGWAGESVPNDKIEIRTYNNDLETLTQLKWVKSITNSNNLKAAGHTDGSVSSAGDEWNTTITYNGNTTTKTISDIFPVHNPVGDIEIAIASKLIDSSADVGAGEATLNLEMEFSCSDDRIGAG